MAVPKRKTSKERKHTRSANWKLSSPNLSECSNCHELIPGHKVCSNCGFYGGKAVIAMKEKQA